MRRGPPKDRERKTTMRNKMEQIKDFFVRLGRSYLAAMTRYGEAFNNSRGLVGA